MENLCSLRVRKCKLYGIKTLTKSATVEYFKEFMVQRQVFSHKTDVFLCIFKKLKKSEF